jgi:hypothetical protein
MIPAFAAQGLYEVVFRLVDAPPSCAARPGMAPSNDCDCWACDLVSEARAALVKARSAEDRAAPTVETDSLALLRELYSGGWLDRVPDRFLERIDAALSEKELP